MAEIALRFVEVCGRDRAVVCGFCSFCAGFFELRPDASFGASAARLVHATLFRAEDKIVGPTLWERKAGSCD